MFTPSTVSWKYIQKSENKNIPVNTICCKLEKAEKRTPYSLLYTPNLGAQFTMFIVHIGRDFCSKLDVVSTCLKTSPNSFFDYETFEKDDYYCCFVIPYKLDIIGFCLQVETENNAKKIFYFDNENIFREDKYTTWGFPSELIIF